MNPVLLKLFQNLSSLEKINGTFRVSSEKDDILRQLLFYPEGESGMDDSMDIVLEPLTNAEGNVELDAVLPHGGGVRHLTIQQSRNSRFWDLDLDNPLGEHFVVVRRMQKCTISNFASIDIFKLWHLGYLNRGWLSLCFTIHFDALFAFPLELSSMAIESSM